MPVYEIPDNHRIRVIFKGFIIAFIKEGNTSEGRPNSWIGALAPTNVDHICHQPKVHVFTINKTTGETTISSGFSNAENFSVVVRKDPTAIQVFCKDKNPFVPFDIHNNPKDFRWFVNLNRVHDLSGEGEDAITIKDGEPLKPIFTLNDGLFHTSDRSDGEMRHQRLRPDNRTAEAEKAFGRVALEITARIYLEGADTATFFNGGSSIFTARAKPPIPSIEDPDIVYDIVYDCRCLTNETESDFGNIYEVIDLPGTTRRVNLIPDPISTPSNVRARKRVGATGQNIDSSPEVYCTGGVFP
jgi:hypothetical protein